MITITKQDVCECVINLCDYFFNNLPITGWVVMGDGVGIITDDGIGHHSEWPCVVSETAAVIQEHTTKIDGCNAAKAPKTIIRITGRFCEGYGMGVEGVVIDSPHLFLVGKPVKVDGRHKYINQYGTASEMLDISDVLH